MSPCPEPACYPIVVLGVSGSGKSTVGKALAERLGLDFYDADDYHPPANVEKMSRGEGLDDGDRAGWLEALNALLLSQMNRRRRIVLACSALKRDYRRTLERDLGGLHWIWLDVQREELVERLKSRKGHFAGTALLESQLNDFEEPEQALRLDGGKSVAELVEATAVAFEK